MRSKFGGWKKWALILGGLVGLYALVGFFLLPAIAKSQIEKRGGEALKRTVSLEKVRFNPFTFRGRLEGLEVSDPTSEKLASWTLVDVNFDPLASLFKWQFYFKEVRLVDPVKWVRVDEEGILNIADLVPADQAEELEEPAEVSNKELPPVGVGLMQIEGWKLDFADASQLSPFRTVIGPMTFDLEGFTTRPDEESPYSLQGTTEAGESFSWSGSVSVQPLGSQGKVEFSGFTIPKYSPYAERFHNAVVRTGTVAFSTEYEVAIGDSLIARLLNTSVNLENLQLSSEGEEDPEVKMGRFAMRVKEADAIGQKAVIETIDIRDIEVKAERRADGSIDLLDWLIQQEETPGPQPEVEETDTPSLSFPEITVENLTLTEATVQLTDQTTPEPAHLEVALASLKVENASSDFSQPVPIQAEVHLNQAGTITVAGTFRPQPLEASIDVELKELSLVPLQPYLESFADVRLAGGIVEAQGHVDASLSGSGEMKADWSGDAAVRNIDVNGIDGESPLLSLTALELKNTGFQLDPLAVKAEAILVQDPAAQVHIAQDGTINLLKALRMELPSTEDPEEELAQESPTETAEAELSRTEQLAEATSQRLPFEAEINVLSIENGTFIFEDESVAGGFATRVEEFGGTIKGLSSDNVARADVDLKAVLNGTAPLAVSGTINPLAEDLYTDLQIDLAKLPLPPFSPYSGKFIAQKIEKGSLSVTISYQLSQRELIGENKVVMDQFYLGEKVESPDSLGLPVGLAVALLRNREGKIDLDVPVRGNLDDPQFKIGRVVMQVIGNIITKAATAPFSLLGNMLGGSAAEMDLSYLDFDPGSLTLSEDGLKKAELLTDALFERPALQLEIQSPSYTEVDRIPLLEARLRNMLLEEKSQLTPEAGASVDASTSLDPEERDALIRSIYLRLNPELAARFQQSEDSEPSASARTSDKANAPRPAKQPTGETPKKKGFLSRVFNSVFGKGEDAESTAPAPAQTPSQEEAVEGGIASQEPSGETEEPVVDPLPSIAEMRNEILDTITLDEQAFRSLASGRAQAIENAILGSGRIEASRLMIPDTAIIPEETEKTTEAARVYFGLN